MGTYEVGMSIGDMNLLNLGCDANLPVVSSKGQGEFGHGC